MEQSAYLYHRMSAHTARLARPLTPTYAKRIHAQIVFAAAATVVKPNELQSALARPIHVSVYEPHQSVFYLAATLSYGIIKGNFSFFSFANLIMI